MQNITVILLSLLVCFCSGKEQLDYRAMLVNYLKNNITDYSPLMIPRLDYPYTVYVSMDIMLSHIVSVDTAKQSIKISAYIKAEWPEERLVWNPAFFGNITYSKWESAHIWYPLILIHNGIADDQVLTPQMPMALKSKTPNLTVVTAIWRREFEFFCDFDLSRFPFDQHTCELLFFFTDTGSDDFVRPVKNTNYPLREYGIYKKCSEWNLINVSGFAEAKPFYILHSENAYYFPTYVLKIEIKRVSQYYLMNVITPLVLLSLLQVLVYLVPIESGEKLGFGITIMLSYTVFLLLLDGILPKSQSMPPIASFITAAMILSTISLLLTSLIMRFHFTPEGTRMPACARTVFVRFLGRLFCVSGSERVDQVTSMVSESSVRKVDDEAIARSEWVIAAQAIERLTGVFGFVATAAIIAQFIVKPYT